MPNSDILKDVFARMNQTSTSPLLTNVLSKVSRPSAQNISDQMQSQTALPQKEPMQSLYTPEKKKNVFYDTVKYFGESLKSFAKTDFGKTMGDIGYAFYDTLDEKPTSKLDTSTTYNPITKTKQAINNISTILENARYYTVGQIFKNTKADDEIAESMKQFSSFYGGEQAKEYKELGLSEMSTWDPRKIAYNTGKGTGSLAMAIGVSLATKNINTGALVLSAMESSGEYTAAREAGKDPNQALKTASISGLGTYISERVGMDYLFKKVGGGALLKTLKHGLVEGVQETQQTWWQNLVAREGYDKSRKLTDGLVDTFISSFITGMIGGIGSEGAQKSVQRQMHQAAVAEAVNQTGLDTESATQLVNTVAEEVNKQQGEFLNELEQELKPGEGEQIITDPQLKKELGIKEQTMIVDQLEISKKSVDRAIEDVAGKVDSLFDTENKFSPKPSEIGNQVRALQKTATAIDSPGKLYKFIAPIIRDSNMTAEQKQHILEGKEGTKFGRAGLAGTIQDIFLQLKPDEQTYRALEKKGQVGGYVQAEEGPITLHRGDVGGQVMTETKNFNQIKTVNGGQSTALQELATQGVQEAADLLQDSTKSFQAYDQFIDQYYQKEGYDAIKYTNEDVQNKPVEYRELATKTSWTPNRVAAQVYSKGMSPNRTASTEQGFTGKFEEVTGLGIQGKVGPFYRVNTMDYGMAESLHGKEFADAVKMNEAVTVYRAGKPGDVLKDGTFLTADKEMAESYKNPNTKGNFGGSEIYTYRIPARDLVSVDNMDFSELVYKPVGGETIKGQGIGSAVEANLPQNLGAEAKATTPKSQQILNKARGIPTGLADAPSEGPVAPQYVQDLQAVEASFGGTDNLSVIEAPEMVRLVRQLTDKIPIIRKLRGNAIGRFYAKNGDIALDPSIFATPGQAEKTMAHEIGHLADWLPDQPLKLKRGNLIGRIKTLNSFLQGSFGNLSNAELRTELKNLTQYWKPFDATTNKEFTAYRYSAKELYADFVSVLFNDPVTAQRIAPKFYTGFFENLDSKPNFKQEFFDLQTMLSNEPANVLKTRAEDIRDMFEKSEKKFSEVRAQNKVSSQSFVDGLQRVLIDENQPILKKIKQAERQGKIINPDNNPKYFLSQRNYLGGKIISFLEKIDPIKKNLTSNQLTWEDMGEYLFHSRVINERTDIANPLGFNRKTSQDQLEYLKQNIGEEKFTILEKSVQDFQSVIKDIMQRAKDEGQLYTDELYDKITTNNQYATFAVLDYLDKTIPASIRQQVGTFKEIANPATATAMKMISVITMTEQQLAKRKTVEFLKDEFKDEIKPAETSYDARYKSQVPKESSDPMFELITVMEDGKLRGYYIDPYIADSFKYNSLALNKALGPVIKLISTPNSKYFRPVFITLNSGFQAFNFVRDFMRTYKNLSMNPSVRSQFLQSENESRGFNKVVKENLGIELKQGRRHGITLWETAQLYSRALKPAIARGFGKQNALISEMRDQGVLGFSFNDIILGRNEEQKQMDYVLEKFQVESGLANQKSSRLLTPVNKLFNIITSIGDTIETLPKVAGYEYLSSLVEQGKMTEQERNYFVRTNVGSPDFLRKGTGYPIYNNIFLFSNAIKEGIRSDIDVAFKNPQTRSGFWWKTAKVGFLPKILMLAAAIGLFGDEYKEAMDKASEYDKTNYTVIPVGQDSDGNTIYIRVPYDETTRILAGLFWKAMTMQSNEQKWTKDTQDIGAFFAGQVPSMSPALDMVSATVQFMAGKNPYDFFYGESVLTDDEMKAGGIYALKPFTKWLIKKAGGDIIFKTNVHDSVTNETTAQKILKAPFIGNIIGRFIKISSQGEIEKNRQIIEAAQGIDSRERLEEKAALNKYVREFNKMSSQGEVTATDAEALYEEMRRDLWGGQTITLEDDNRLRKKFQIGILRGYNDVNINALITANTKTEQTMLLQSFYDGMDYADFKELIEFAVGSGVISKDTANEFAKNIKR